MTVLAENKKAYFDYDILEKFQAGIVLIGQEVKSLKTKGVSLAGNYITLKNEEVFCDFYYHNNFFSLVCEL